MEEMGWHIFWLAALTPDLAIIPASTVFTDSVQKYSLTATVEGTPPLLLSPADPHFALLDEQVNRATVTLKYTQQSQKRQEQRTSWSANTCAAHTWDG